jgi:hypothetical protein
LGKGEATGRSEGGTEDGNKDSAGVKTMLWMMVMGANSAWSRILHVGRSEKSLMD